MFCDRKLRLYHRTSGNFPVSVIVVIHLDWPLIALVRQNVANLLSASNLVSINRHT